MKEHKEQLLFPVDCLELFQDLRRLYGSGLDLLQPLDESNQFLSAVVAEVFVVEDAVNEKSVEKVGAESVELLLVAENAAEHLFAYPDVLHESKLVDYLRSGVIAVKIGDDVGKLFEK